VALNVLARAAARPAPPSRKRPKSA
jgi:hypothetical protein